MPWVYVGSRTTPSKVLNREDWVHERSIRNDRHALGQVVAGHGHGGDLSPRVRVRGGRVKVMAFRIGLVRHTCKC